jgi:pentose-5-phosphate-3-epimerase
MMCADFFDLKHVLDIFVQERIDYLHIDIIDGHYAPNFTLGVEFCKSLYGYTAIPLDIHLMIDNHMIMSIHFLPLRDQCSPFIRKSVHSPPLKAACRKT